MADPETRLPPLKDLHQRHRGLYRSLCSAYADAAAICMSETYESPVDVALHVDDRIKHRKLFWDEPGEDARASWANQDDATRDGAYSVSLAAVEAELGLTALERADRRTGADFYIGVPGTDLEDAHRLEVSGTRNGDQREINARLRQKVEQASRGESDRPAYACVVGFKARLVAVARVTEDAE